MSDTPERILVRVDYDGTHDGTWIAAAPYEPPIEYSGSEPLYARADLSAPQSEVDAVREENMRLKAELAEARDKTLVEAHDAVDKEMPQSYVGMKRVILSLRTPTD